MRLQQLNIKMDHAAYLGKELKKAEMCMVLGCDYYQE